MTMPSIKRTRLWASLPLILLPAVGCTEYTIDTTLRADGSGTRTVQVETEEATDLEEYGITTDDFLELLRLDGPEWDHQTIGDPESPDHRFERTRTLTGLESWSDLNDEIHISGAVRQKARQTIGYVTLGNVRFSNRVLVGRSARSDGTGSHTYQETFFWEDGVDALIEIILTAMEDRVSVAFPDLPRADRGEVLGQARGHLWEAVEDGVLDAGDDEEELWGRAVVKTATRGVRVIQKTYPEAGEQTLQEALNVFEGEGDEAMIDPLVNTLPGLNLAFNSAITFRLTLPGRVVTSNAHDQEGTTLIWEFSPADALTAPVVIQAESLTGG